MRKKVEEKPVEAKTKKTTKKVSRPKKKKEPKTEVLDFDVNPTVDKLGAWKEEAEIVRLKAELSEAREEVDKMSARMHRKIGVYQKCVEILMNECNWLVDEMPWWKKRSKKFRKEVRGFMDDFLEEYVKVGLGDFLRAILR